MFTRRPSHWGAWYFAVWVTLLVVLGSARGGEHQGARTIPVLASTTATVASFPLTVTDAWGRAVTLRTPPQRLISLAPSITETLFAIGAGDRLVGVTFYDDYPPPVQSLPRVGGYVAQSISVEKILGLRPDLVLSYGELQRSVVTVLAGLQVPVVAVAPQRFDEVYATILLLGRLTGRLEQASQVVMAMQQRIARIQQRTAGIPPARRITVFYEVYDEPLITAGPATFIGQMITMAGGINIFADLRTRYAQVSAEEVVRRNPAVILGPNSHGRMLRHIRQRPGWQRIAAVRHHRIYLLDGNLVSRPGPRLTEALETVAQALYPELFAQRKTP